MYEAIGPLCERKALNDQPSQACNANIRPAGLPLLIVAAVLSHPPITSGNPQGYSFKVIASLGDPAPGGGSFVNDFEPSAVQNGADVAFTADVSTGGEGVLLSATGRSCKSGE